jgi:hypothetical protein
MLLNASFFWQSAAKFPCFFAAFPVDYRTRSGARHDEPAARPRFLYCKNKCKSEKPSMNEAETVLESRRANEEELFYLKLARDEFAASLGRIEETAKYLVGAIGAVAGLVLAGLQVKLAVNTGANVTALTWPFLLWGLSGLFAILVFFPLPYRPYRNAPQDIRSIFVKARSVKWSLLLLSVVAFGAGLIVAALQF